MIKRRMWWHNVTPIYITSNITTIKIPYILSIFNFDRHSTTSILIFETVPNFGNAPEP